ncbi:MAG: hypothetical protein IIY55_09075, partial [Blautia sp.]|nr:hypothetical protein [Blautia sp.]
MIAGISSYYSLLQKLSQILFHDRTIFLCYTVVTVHALTVWGLQHTVMVYAARTAISLPADVAAWGKSLSSSRTDLVAGRVPAGSAKSTSGNNVCK